MINIKNLFSVKHKTRCYIILKIIMIRSLPKLFTWLKYVINKEIVLKTASKYYQWSDLVG